MSWMFWVDELEKADDGWEKEEKRETLELLVQPIEKLAKEGKLKALRSAAKECLADERLIAWRGQKEDEVSMDEDEDEVEWGGFGE